MDFEQKCRELGGKVETNVCVIKNPKASNFIDIIGRPMEKIGTTLYTTPTILHEVDFVVFREPELVTELIRIRYKPEKRIPVRVEITKEGMKKLGVV